MPTVFCSTKLSKLIGLKTRLPSLSLDNWNGHLFTLQGRKCIAFVHKETFYSFVLFDILKNDLKDFKQIFMSHFLEQLQDDKLLTNELKDLIVKDFETFEISTTDGDTSTIGYLNDCITRLTWEREGRPPTIEESKFYVKNGYNENRIGVRKYSKANEFMRERLKNYAQQSL